MSFSINGLVSGLDTAQIISDLMQLERLPYTRLETQKTNLQSEQSIFRNINTKLSKLQTAIADLKLSSTFNLSSATSTDESAVKATASESASSGNFNVVVEQLAKNHTIKSATIDPAGTTLRSQSFVIDRDGTANDLTIDLSSLSATATDGEVLEYVKNQINLSSTGLTASIMSVDDASNKVLVLSSKETGAENKIVAGNAAAGTGEIGISGTGFGTLGFSDAASITSKTTQAAQNAKFTVNGVGIDKSSNTVSDVISGVTLQLLKDGNASSTVSVAADGDKVAAKVEAFVTAYNDVISTVKDNLAKPSDKTKMNPLQGDSLLKEISNSLYNLFTDLSGSTGGFQMMSQLGLSIDKGITSATLMTGKITFDKEQFKAKLNENATAVTDLFKASGTGIMHALDDQLSVWTSSANGLLTSKIKGYDSEIEMVDDRLIAMSDRLAMKEQQLKSQFTAMEVAMSSLKNQQSWMANQLAALTPSKSS